MARRDREKVLRVHRNAQRLLRPLLVVNPHAPELTFLDDKTRMRRDHVKYLTLINAVTLLHQYQREVRTTEHEGVTVEYVEVALEDIEVANRLAHEVLGRSLDELAPQTRRLLLLVHELVARESKLQRVKPRDVRFTRRQVREATGWSDAQLQTHLRRLEELEYLLAHRGMQGQGFVYELVYDGKGQDGTPFLPGLLDTATLRPGQGEKFCGQKGEFCGPGTEFCGGPVDELKPFLPPSVGPASGLESSTEASFKDKEAGTQENAHLDEGRTSYRKAGRSDTAEGVN